MALERFRRHDAVTSGQDPARVRYSLMRVAIRATRRNGWAASINRDHFFGRANAMISSFVTCDPVSPPPVLTTVTNCRPSAPGYVIGVVSTDEGNLISHSFSPVAVAK